jgi:hypothetical protein
MVKWSVALLLALGTAITIAPARAQTVAQQMTCEQAVAYFERNGVIYTIVHGKVLPVTRGVPIRKERGLGCTGPNRNRFTYAVRTLDKRSCVISVYCQ